MLVAPLALILSLSLIRMYSLSGNEEKFSVAFLLLYVSFSFSFSLYDVLFFWPCSHHHVVLKEKEIRHVGKICLESTLKCTKLIRSLSLAYNVS